MKIVLKFYFKLDDTLYMREAINFNQIVNVMLVSGEVITMTINELSDYALRTMRDVTLVPELLNYNEAIRGSVKFTLI